MPERKSRAVEHHSTSQLWKVDEKALRVFGQREAQDITIRRNWRYPRAVALGRNHKATQGNIPIVHVMVRIEREIALSVAELELRPLMRPAIRRTVLSDIDCTWRNVSFDALRKLPILLLGRYTKSREKSVETTFEAMMRPEMRNCLPNRRKVKGFLMVARLSKRLCTAWRRSHNLTMKQDVLSLPSIAHSDGMPFPEPKLCFTRLSRKSVRLIILARGHPINQTAGSRHEELCRSEEHTSELQSPCNLVCRLLLEKK